MSDNRITPCVLVFAIAVFTVTGWFRPVALGAANLEYQDAQLDSFLGEPAMEMQQIYTGGRFPSIVVALDGTVLACWGQNTLPRVRRSGDGGATWGDQIVIGDDPAMAGVGLGAAVVDETTGDVIVFMDGVGGDWEIGHSWRSRDHGKTWEHNGQRKDIVAYNGATVINDEMYQAGSAFTHGADSGITLRYGQHKGRLLMPARVMPGWSNARENWPTHYNCAMYSDDGGYTWQTSAPFPALGTGEAALAELSSGVINYNSRRHLSTDGLSPLWRHIAWSYDDGHTWQDLSVSDVLPDGNQDSTYGLMGGLVRLPVRDQDILIFSNIDSNSGRQRMTVWGSFDGGQTWPVKRLVFDGPSAYSSMTAGRPGTPSEGWIYLMFEGGPNYMYQGAQFVRFNLSWLLDGQQVEDFLDGCFTPGTYLPGDLNRDCYVDFKDFVLLAQDWLSCTDPANIYCISP